VNSDGGFRLHDSGYIGTCFRRWSPNTADAKSVPAVAGLSKFDHSAV
jgi:hypothetical protein